MNHDFSKPKKKVLNKSKSQSDKGQKELIEKINQHKSNNNILFSNNYLSFYEYKKFCYYTSILKYKLSNKYKTTEDTYNNYLIERLIGKKRGHILAKYRDMEIYNFIHEYNKRFYHLNESIVKIPKFAIYYKNYSLFFCCPTLADQACNKIMNKHMEKIAQIFFDQNYVNKNKKNKKLEVEKEKTEINIFNKGVIEEIEIDVLPQKKKFYTGFNSFDKDTSFFDNISNINPFPKSQLNLNELKDFKINQSNNNYIVDSESTLSNSINSILSILTTKKEKIKINYLNNKNNDKDNNIFNDNKNNNNNNTIHLINNNYVNNNINMRNNSMNYKTISNVFQTPKKKTNYISSNSSLKNSKIKSYKKISEKKGLVSQLTNNVISSSNFHSNYNIDYRRSFHTKYSSQYFNEQIEIKKTSSNNKLKSPSNLKNTFSNNNSKKDTNKNVRNILKVLSQNENNTSPLKNNIKTPIDFYLTQSKLFKSPTNDLRESERKKSNLKSSRNSKNIVFNFQNSSKKIIKKSSIEDSTISIQSRNLLRNSHNNINKLIHNSGKKNNIINNNFSSGHKNNQILTKKGKLIFPNKEISTRANSNDYNLIKPQISLLTFC
jgi:hypothetical protein